MTNIEIKVGDKYRTHTGNEGTFIYVDNNIVIVRANNGDEFSITHNSAERSRRRYLEHYTNVTDASMKTQLIEVAGTEVDSYDIDTMVSDIQASWGTVDINIIPAGALYDYFINHQIEDEPNTDCHCGHPECGAC